MAIGKDNTDAMIKLADYYKDIKKYHLILFYTFSHLKRQFCRRYWAMWGLLHIKSYYDIILL